MRLFFASVVAIVGLSPVGASAQRLLAHDTLSMSTPSVVSCGFCQDEVIGVVFRELPAGAGIRASDFPLGLTFVSVALADAMTDGTSCNADMTGGMVNAAIEIWTGATPPTALPPASTTFGMPWPGETLVFANDMVPITLSTPTTAGSTMFNLQFNAFEPRDEMDRPIVVPAGNGYLRVAVRLPGSGGFNSVCADPIEVPGGFPLRDDDGRIDTERSFIYAQGGTGWLWNEDAGLNGDWAIRIEVNPMGMPVDAGPRDAGRRDAGGTDTGAPSMDTGTDAGAAVPSGGCGCVVAPRSPAAMGSLMALGLLIAWIRRSRGR